MSASWKRWAPGPGGSSSQAAGPWGSWPPGCAKRRPALLRPSGAPCGICGPCWRIRTGSWATWRRGSPRGPKTPRWTAPRGASPVDAQGLEHGGGQVDAAVQNRFLVEDQADALLLGLARHGLQSLGHVLLFQGLNLGHLLVEALLVLVEEFLLLLVLQAFRLLVKLRLEVLLELAQLRQGIVQLGLQVVGLDLAPVHVPHRGHTLRPGGLPQEAHSQERQNHHQAQAEQHLGPAIHAPQPGHQRPILHAATFFLGFRSDYIKRLFETQMGAGSLKVPS